MPTPHYDHSGPAPFQPVAAVLAIVFPGAGHAYLGEIRRAVLIASGVMGLFFGGILVGGIDVVDRKEDFVWFIGEGLVGPIAFGVDYYHQNFLKVRDGVGAPPRSAFPNEGRDPKTGVRVEGGKPPNSRSLGRVNELGTLFATIAGMLNLICIIDAAFRHRAPAPTVGAPGVGGGGRGVGGGGMAR